MTPPADEAPGAAAAMPFGAPSMLALEDALKLGKEVGIPAPLARLNIFRLLLHHPKLAKVFSDFLGSLLVEPVGSPRHGELAIMRVAWLTGSSYEWTQHWGVARAFGIPEEDLLGVRAWQESDRFDDAERAVLQATDDMVTSGSVDPSTLAALRASFGDGETADARLIEIVAAIGGWRMVASWLLSFGVPLEEGVTAWPPDGKVPPAT